MAKARDVLSIRVREAAGAVVQHWDGGSDDPGNILDHVDSSILGGKALRSPVIRNWIVKLVKEKISPKEAVEPNEFDNVEEYTKDNTSFVFIWTKFTVETMKTVNDKEIKKKLLSYPEAIDLKKLLLTNKFVLTS